MDDWPKRAERAATVGGLRAVIAVDRARYGHQPAPPAEGEQRHPAPVPVSERPWEREGWCDRRGQCWMGDPGGGGFIPSWRLCRPEDAPRMRVSLPFNALPLPADAGEPQP